MKKPRYPKVTGTIAEKGITQKEIAEKLGIAPEVLSRKLSGKVDFKLKEAVEIYNICSPDITLPEFFGYK